MRVRVGEGGLDLASWSTTAMSCFSSDEEQLSAVVSVAVAVSVS